MDDKRMEVTGDFPTTDELHSFHLISKYFGTIQFLMQKLSTPQSARTRFPGGPEPNYPEYDFEWTIVLLETLRNLALDQLDGMHELNREAHALIYEILDTMFPGRKEHSHQNENLFTEYKKILDHAVENPPAPMTGMVDRASFDFVVDPERIRFVWKQAYDSCMPNLQKVAYKMKTWLLIAEFRGDFSGGELQSNIRRHGIREPEYWTVPEAQEYVHENVYPGESGDKIFEMIRHQLRRAATRGDIIRKGIAKPVLYEKASVLLWALRRKSMGDAEGPPLYLDDKEFEQ